MGIIDNINALLTKRGLTGGQMCRELGLSTGVYSQWCSGRSKPSLKTVKKIADYFGVPLSLLYEDSVEAIESNYNPEMIDRLMSQEMFESGQKEKPTPKSGLEAELLSIFNNASAEDKVRLLELAMQIKAKHD